MEPDVWYKITPDTDPFTIFNGLYFLDENIGWIVGKTKCIEDRDNCAGNKAVSWRTRDGGKTWGKSAFPVYEHSFRDVYFFDDLNGVALFRNNHKSTDGGKNWNDLGNIGGISFFNDIEFADDQIGWLAGKHGTDAGVYKTIDQGNSWFVLEGSVDSVISTLYFEVNALSTTELYVRGWKSLIYSDDGGATWEYIQLPVAHIRYESMKFITTNNGWIGGEWRELFHTENSGQSWAKVDIEFGYDAIYCLDAIDSLHVVAGTSDGIVLVTNDGWNTYTEHPIGTEGSGIQKMQYLDSGLIYAIEVNSVWKAKLSM